MKVLLNYIHQFVICHLCVPLSALMAGLLQDPKMLADLDSRGLGNLDSRTVTICSGLDLVNISYNNFVAADEKTAKVRVVVSWFQKMSMVKCA